MMKYILSAKLQLLFLAVSALTLLGASANAAAIGQYLSGNTGVDMSYPNCTSKVPSASFGIVGVTDGLGFSQNPCMAAEAAYFGNLSLYVNTGYPGSYRGLDYQSFPKACPSDDLNCLAYNYGYNAGQYAIDYANSQGVHSNTWWLDVETANSWTTDPAQNQNSLQGEQDALSAAGATMIGVYSTTAQWDSVTGSWQNNWPSWGATTWTTAKQAAKYCTGHQFTGGPSVLMQYNVKSLDHDYAC